MAVDVDRLFSPPNNTLGAWGFRQIVTLVLLALAVNAVLVQTVLPEESPLKNFIRIGGLGLVIGAMFFRNIRLPLWAAILVLTLVIFMLLKDNLDPLAYVFVLLLVPALCCLQERKVLRIMVMSSIVALTVVFLLLGLGITIQDVVGGDRERNTFGTRGVPFFSNVVFGACALLLVYSEKFVRSKIWRLAWAIVTLGAAWWFFTQTDGRGGFYAFLVLFVGIPLVRAMKWAHPLRYLLAILPIGLIIAPFIIATQSEDAVANEALSNRPSLYQSFIDQLSPWDVFLGTSVQAFDNSSLSIVDSSYLHLLVGGGLLMTGVFLILFARATVNLYEAKRYPDVAFLVATCVYCFSESLLVRVENMFIIYFWYLILRFSQTHSLRRAGVIPSKGG